MAQFCQNSFRLIQPSMVLHRLVLRAVPMEANRHHGSAPDRGHEMKDDDPNLASRELATLTAKKITWAMAGRTTDPGHTCLGSDGSR
jgi:hypothetical protein